MFVNQSLALLVLKLYFLPPFNSLVVLVHQLLVEVSASLFSPLQFHLGFSQLVIGLLLLHLHFGHFSVQLLTLFHFLVDEFFLLLVVLLKVTDF